MNATGITKKDPILSVHNLSVCFNYHKLTLKAVDNVSFKLYQGETLGLVGESGCGKSTLAKAMLGLVPTTHGEVIYNNQNLLALNLKAWLPFRRELQIVFQDPLASLNPRMTIAEILAEPLCIHCPQLTKKEISYKVFQTIEMVGLQPYHSTYYSYQCSGGQCQRINIARSIITKPKVIMLDESVSALDVSIQAQIINLLKQLQSDFGLTMIFISHDLSVIQHLSDRVIVMYLGEIMELADKKALFANPHHPYTKLLLAAIPKPDPRTERLRKRGLLKGDLPSPINKPSGCVFYPRCPIAKQACKQTKPTLDPLTQVACINPMEHGQYK